VCVVLHDHRLGRHSLTTRLGIFVASNPVAAKFVAANRFFVVVRFPYLFFSFFLLFVVREFSLFLFSGGFFCFATVILEIPLVSQFRFPIASGSSVFFPWLVSPSPLFPSVLGKCTSTTTTLIPRLVLLRPSRRRSSRISTPPLPPQKFTPTR
jgi:hypothetical protein